MKNIIATSLLILLSSVAHADGFYQEVIGNALNQSSS